MAEPQKIGRETRVESDSGPPRHDALLISSAQRGAPGAFAALWKLYQPWITHQARRILRNDADAEEVVNDVGFKLSESIGGFRGECKLSTWVFRMIARCCIDRIRKNRKERMTEQLQDSIGAEQPTRWQEIEMQEMLEIAQHVYDQLKPEDQAIVKLQYQTEATVQEIATKLDMKASKVYDRLELFLEKVATEAHGQLDVKKKKGVVGA
jgi:RNA polymerase sigma-70 factor (ECF subfamily)